MKSSGHRQPVEPLISPPGLIQYSRYKRMKHLGQALYPVTANDLTLIFSGGGLEITNTEVSSYITVESKK